MYLLFEAGTLILHCFHSSDFFPAKGIYPVCDRVHLILSFYLNIHCQSFSEKPCNASQIKRFEKEFCFFIAFDSLNLLKQKRYSSSYYRQKKAKYCIYNLLIFYFISVDYLYILSFYLNLHCQSFSEKPCNAYQIKRFEKEFCFFSAFDSLNLLKQKRYSSSYYRQKKAKYSIYT